MDTFIYDSKEEKFYLPDKKISYQDYFNQISKNKNKLGCNIFYEDKYVINLSQNSKIITFEDFDQIHKIFISNEEQVIYLIDFFGFEKYAILKKGIEVKNILISLDFDTIKRVKNYLKNDEYLIANKAINDSYVPLNSLSLLYDKYQKFEDALSNKFN